MKIQKQNIGVWVKASEELPEDSDMYYTKCELSELRGDTNVWITPDFKQISYYAKGPNEWHVNWEKIKVTHWLKPIEQVYVLTEQELSEMVNTIFNNLKSGDITKALQSITQ